MVGNSKPFSDFLRVDLHIHTDKGKETKENDYKGNFSVQTLYDKITEPNFEETTLPAMLAYTIYTALRSGWLDASYKAPADKMRAAVYANVDELGLLQNASKAPRFNTPGTSPEGQAFFLMMEGAYRKLNQ